MGKNYFTCSFLIFSIVSDNLRKKFLSIIKSWHWFSSCLSEREIWAYFLKWTRTQLPKMFLFCPFFMYGTMKKYSSSSMYKDGGSLFQKNNECWKRLTLTSTESKTKPINNCIYISNTISAYSLENDYFYENQKIKAFVNFFIYAIEFK